MRTSADFQLFGWLMFSVCSVQSIMVKYGTNDGPIVPPTPEPSVAPSLPYRDPAPVWEDKAGDTPDPNAHWRPPLFVPQQRYTQVLYNMLPKPQEVPLTNAQKFVNSYLPKQNEAQPSPIPAGPLPTLLNYRTHPVAVLSSQAIPGLGTRYLLPAYVEALRANKFGKTVQEDAKHNDIEANEVNEDSKDSASDAQWKYEKEAGKRVARTSREGTPSVYVYQWPTYVPHRHQ